MQSGKIITSDVYHVKCMKKSCFNIISKCVGVILPSRIYLWAHFLREFAKTTCDLFIFFVHISPRNVQTQTSQVSHFEGNEREEPRKGKGEGESLTEALYRSRFKAVTVIINKLRVIGIFVNLITLKLLPIDAERHTVVNVWCKSHLRWYNNDAHVLRNSTLNGSS